MLKQLWRKVAPNPLDLCLKRASKTGRRTFLICWNRGLGDIPLGLYALVFRIRQSIPSAEITFLTRQDLSLAMAFLENVKVLVGQGWRRGELFDVKQTLAELGKSIDDFDIVLEKPDPTYWLKWQLGKLIPKLPWQGEWDALSKPYLLSAAQKYIGVHVQTETSYGYQKNWPKEHWDNFFKSVSSRLSHPIILFGFKADPTFDHPQIIDLRGKTNLLEMLSVIKNHCAYLLVPDSGILSMTYFLDADFPLKIASLWADPNQGVLKQNVPSPNKELHHIPLIAENRDITTIAVQQAFDALFPPADVQQGTKCV